MIIGRNEISVPHMIRVFPNNFQYGSAKTPVQPHHPNICGLLARR